jgi:hypothetical protein
MRSGLADGYRGYTLSDRQSQFVNSRESRAPDENARSSESPYYLAEAALLSP